MHSPCIMFVFIYVLLPPLRSSFVHSYGCRHLCWCSLQCSLPLSPSQRVCVSYVFKMMLCMCVLYPSMRTETRSIYDHLSVCCPIFDNVIVVNEIWFHLFCLTLHFTHETWDSWMFYMLYIFVQMFIYFVAELSVIFFYGIFHWISSSIFNAIELFHLILFLHLSLYITKLNAWNVHFNE